jgi:hypothetical protein
MIAGEDQGSAARAMALSPPPPPASEPPAAPAKGNGDDLPDGAALLALEKRVRRQGSGLGPAELEGRWQFTRIWPKGRPQPSPLAGVLLRGLGACLRIEAEEGNAAAPLRLTNAVTLGSLELRFQGPGWLRGRRPLLQFTFDTMQLRAGERVLWQRSLPTPPPQRLPFFALIATGPERRWLAARGRSGGLALWCQSPTALSPLPR